MNPTPPVVVLSFTQSDPTGAGGALADALTCASMGCHLVWVCTSTAVQDSRQVEDVLVLDAEWVDEQARALLQDMPVAAFKVAALGTADNAKAVAEVLADYPDVPVVFDPVSAPGGADADAELIAAMRELLLPQTTVLTVNLAQARRLIAIATDDDAAEEFDAARCARSLLEWGAENVLITQADATSTHVINRLFADDGAVQNESLDHADANFRGAGDTLSAGIAALLAQGLAVGDAVREANDYLDQALAGGYRVGMGAAIPDRLFWASVDGADDADAQDAEPDGTEDGERQ